MAHLRQNGAGVHTQIYALYYKNNWPVIQSIDINKALREAVEIDVPQAGFKPKYVNVHSMRAGDAMALLLSRFDKDTIRIMGR